MCPLLSVFNQNWNLEFLRKTSNFVQIRPAILGYKQIIGWPDRHSEINMRIFATFACELARNLSEEPWGRTPGVKLGDTLVSGLKGRDETNAFIIRICN